MATITVIGVYEEILGFSLFFNPNSHLTLQLHYKPILEIKILLTFLKKSVELNSDSTCYLLQGDANTNIPFFGQLSAKLRAAKV